MKKFTSNYSIYYYIIIIMFIIIIPTRNNSFATNNIKIPDKKIALEPQKQSTVNSKNVVSYLDNVNDRRDYLVISKNPEFFTYTLSTITILLTIMTIILGLATGVGLTVVLKVNKERKELEGMRKHIEEQKDDVKKSLKADYDKLIEAMHKTVYGLATLHNAKTEISRMLIDDVKKDLIFKEIQKTIPHPDADCIRLYAKILEKYENDLDMVRLVRNGLMQFNK